MASRKKTCNTISQHMSAHISLGIAINRKTLEAGSSKVLQFHSAMCVFLSLVQHLLRRASPILTTPHESYCHHLVLSMNSQHNNVTEVHECEVAAILNIVVSFVHSLSAYHHW